MRYNRLGNSDLQVSAICLGTMTYGEQNTPAQAEQQLDMALDAGVNFIDTAEMYPVPPRAETQGRTERYIGDWMQRRKNRNKLIVATKVVGPGLQHIRQGPRLNAQHIQQAVEHSLQRLQTDCIDLYQVHWPERSSNFFGKLGYSVEEKDGAIAIKETLAALEDCRQQGKIRHIGISNETAWGAMHYLALAKEQGWAPIVSVQNPYNLLNRSYEVGLAEVSHREKIGLLAYSPLGFGVLSGKYDGDQWPPEGRLTKFKMFARYLNPISRKATSRYLEIARQHDLLPSQMALAFINAQPFVSSNIIGATTVAQLQENLDSASLTLSAEVREQIEQVHLEHSNPCP